MWATLALTTTLGLVPAAPSGKIEFNNVRATYGLLGQERKGDKFQPGDEFIVTCDVEGLTVKGDGQIVYTWSMELLDAKGAKKFTSDPATIEAFNTLGGGRIVFTTRTEIGLDTPPGDYTLKVTIADRNAKGVQNTLVRKFTVTTPSLGFVRPSFQNISESKAIVPSPPIGVPGQTLLLSFAIVGFQLDTKTNQPKVLTEIQFLDESGKAVLPKPIRGLTNKVDRDEYKKILPQQFPLELNRAGKFKIQLKVTDETTRKTSELLLDLNVIELK